MFLTLCFIRIKLQCYNKFASMRYNAEKIALKCAARVDRNTIFTRNLETICGLEVFVNGFTERLSLGVN